MESIREWPQYKTLELNQYDTPQKLLKTNGSEYSCETRPITQTSGCNTGVKHRYQTSHRGFTPVFTRQNSTRVLSRFCVFDQLFFLSLYSWYGLLVLMVTQTLNYLSFLVLLYVDFITFLEGIPFSPTEHLYLTSPWLKQSVFRASSGLFSLCSVLSFYILASILYCKFSRLFEIDFEPIY